MSGDTTIIYCDCAHYDIIGSDVKSAVLDALAGSGLEFHAVSDLCELAAVRDSRLKEWAGAESVRIIACYPRGVKWLFHVAGADLKPDCTKVLNMRTTPAEEIISSLLPGEEQAGTYRDIDLGQKGAWVPWFPVIDYDRCVNCKQCMNFCLFGVYDVDEEGQVRVVKPDGCKTNCPACARVCPQAAIIFPKYEGSGINGDEVTDDVLKKETTGVNVSSLLDGDIREAIRQRSRKGRRFAASTGNSPGGGASTVNELQHKLSIPNEVLRSLSAKDIVRIRERTIAKKGQGEDDGD